MPIAGTPAVRGIRPAASPGFERRFETPPGRQAQVGFAHVRATFTDAPGAERVARLGLDGAAPPALVFSLNGAPIRVFNAT